MAFGKSNAAPAPKVEEEIAPRFPTNGPWPRLDDLPEVAQALALFRHLEAEHAKRTRQITILAIQDNLKSRALRHQQGAPESNQVIEARARLRSLAAITPPPVPMSASDVRDEHQDVDAALKIIARVPAPKMPTAAELHAEIATIHKAEIVAWERVEALRSVGNHEMHLALRERQRALAVAVYHAAVALSEAVAAERGMDYELVQLGYKPRGDLFTWPALPAAYRIGYLNDRNSQLVECRRRLEELGIEL